MKQGNMEAYFTLAEHLITQAEPSTCGPTSLSMIVNTLHIDPDRHWKGYLTSLDFYILSF